MRSGGQQQQDDTEATDLEEDRGSQVRSFPSGILLCRKVASRIARIHRNSCAKAWMPPANPRNFGPPPEEKPPAGRIPGRVNRQDRAARSIPIHSNDEAEDGDRINGPTMAYARGCPTAGAMACIGISSSANPARSQFDACGRCRTAMKGARTAAGSYSHPRGESAMVKRPASTQRRSRSSALGSHIGDGSPAPMPIRTAHAGKSVIRYDA